jgi:putative ABC transport system permease protein
MHFRHALRVLLKRPAFTVLAILTLALGIGANTAIFSVVNGVLLRPLPYPQPDELVRLWEHTSRSPRVNVSYPNLRDWRARLKSFDAIAGYQTDLGATVLGGTAPATADVYSVTRDFFRVLGVAPALGRAFTSDETAPGGPAAIVVSDRFWRRLLAGNPDLQALHLDLEGVSARVVGVMPAGFEFPSGADIWLPQEHWADTSGRSAHNYRVLGRLNTSFDRADAELQLIAGQVRAEDPSHDDAQSITMVQLQDALTGGSRTALLLLLGAVALVLLIACVNVASTMIARGEERRAEIAVRAALGATRARIVQQLLLESLLLGVTGAACGLALGAWLLRAFLSLNTVPLGGQRVALDGSVLAFTGLLGILTPLLFGILPALHASRPNLRDTMIEGGRGSVGTGRRIVRSVLVAAEAGIALVLLVGAALLIDSFWKLLSVDAGFDPHGVAAINLSVPQTRYGTPEASARFYQELLDRMRAIPGVEMAAVTTVPPLTGGGPSGSFVLDGVPPSAESQMVADYFVVSPGYFTAMRIPLVRGRALEESDSPGKDVVAVVNQQFVRKYLPNENPIGRRFRYLGMDSANEPMITIVGVAADVRNDSLSSPAVPEAYVSYLQRPNRTRWPLLLVVRVRQPGALAAVFPSIRGAMAAADPDVPARIGTLEALVSDSVSDRRFMMAVLSSFAFAALLLAAVGIYGVLSQTVLQRRPEIGIRMALGAKATSVLWMVMASAMRPVLAGVVCGVIGAALSMRALQSLLFGVTPLDPTAFAAAAALLIVVALAAAFVPARRATRIDPLVALRRA